MLEYYAIYLLLPLIKNMSGCCWYEKNIYRFLKALCLQIAAMSQFLNKIALRTPSFENQEGCCIFDEHKK